MPFLENSTHQDECRAVICIYQKISEILTFAAAVETLSVEYQSTFNKHGLEIKKKKST